MNHFAEKYRGASVSVVGGDPREAAVDFLRHELSEEVKDEFREVIRIGALATLDAVVGRVVQEMLRARGFGESELGVQSLDVAWRDLVCRAVEPPPRDQS